MKPVTVAIMGAGGRGTGYAAFAKERPDQMKVVGVAEPRDAYRQRMVEQHAIPPENTFTDWKQAARKPRFADAVLICTQDAMHRGPAEAFARKGYHILLEKPMAPNPADCKAIVKAVKKADIVFGVCHVMRYTRYTQCLKALLDSGRIGEIVSVQHLEPVGYWHQAHSFVRGNWRNEKESSFMLLAKSCHDIDWLRYIVGRPCRKVSSFGSVKHFRADQKPAGAADRCMDCGVEATCPYSAKRFYLGRVAKGEVGWPVDVLSTDTSMEGITRALREGPYGRCVYACDNDVVDHQVVNMEFDSDATVAFTMTAFSKSDHRQTRIFGTRGQVTGDGVKLKVFDFLTDKEEVIDTETSTDASLLSGHGGGDGGLIGAFVKAVATGDRSQILSGPDETLESHLMVFAAEKARRRGSVVKIEA